MASAPPFDPASLPGDVTLDHTIPARPARYLPLPAGLRRELALPAADLAPADLRAEDGLPADGVAADRPADPDADRRGRGPDDPAWLDALARTLLRTIVRNKLSDGEWPRRITRWRPEPRS